MVLLQFGEDEGLVSGGAEARLDFSIQVDTGQLGVDADRVESLITVQADPGGALSPAAPAAVILVMDMSLSMVGQNKFRRAQVAVCTAIDAIPDGAFFGIIAGNEKAARVFPPAGELATIDAGTREAAKRAVKRLLPSGGTKIGRWLTAVSELFAEATAAVGVRHAVLYSDGKNEHETREELDAAIAACAGRFVCDVRGLGDDWDYRELRHITDALQGDAVAVLDVRDLAADLTALMERVRRIIVPRAYLRLSPTSRFRIASIAQTHPVRVEVMQEELADGSAIDVPLGAWEEREVKRYHVSLRFDPSAVPIEQRLRAARVDLCVEEADGTRVSCADAPLTMLRNAMPDSQTVLPDDSLTRIEDERLLGLAMQACVDAWILQKADEANKELNEAFRLARSLGDVRLPLLKSVSAVAPGGTARLRANVTLGEMQELGLNATGTERRNSRLVPSAQEAQEPGNGHGCGPPRPVARTRDCHCGQSNDEDADFCASCGAPLHGRATS